MRKPARRLQPRSFHAFRCIGAACEDTCCVGWIVNVDQRTYEAYQRCEDPDLGPRLRELVTINPEGSAESHARIALSGPGCPFLANGLCSIQGKLGEDHLSTMCAVYPRVMNMVDDVLQQSLDVSCPEAARIVLLEPAPLEFVEDPAEQNGTRWGLISSLNTSGAGTLHAFFSQIQELVIWILQQREYSIWRRLTMVASLCDQLHATSCAGAAAETPEILDVYRDAMNRHLFDDALNSHRPQGAKQLEVVLELVVSRIGSDFTPPRFLDCYREFMAGLRWTTESSLNDLAQRYTEAHRDYYAPLMDRHEYILEHYLANYAYRTLFPLGPQESSRGLNAPLIARSTLDHAWLMLSHFAIVQTILVGAAAHRGENFDLSDVIRVIQSSTKTFEHSLAFPDRALEIVRDHGIASAAGLAVLLLN